MSRGSSTPDDGGLSREAMLARVRRALGRADDDGPGSPTPQPPEVDDTLARLCEPDVDLAARFAEKAAAAGMCVHRVGATQLASTLRDVLKSEGASRATYSVHDGAHMKVVRKAMKDVGVELVDATVAETGPVGVDTHYDVDVGITGVEAAIAETGSLVITSGAGRSRGAPLIPPVHVAIVGRDQIVPDLLDFWAAWTTGDEPWPAATITVTGPSKTADIEGILITGVHGPAVVHVMLVDG
jgi:L-lactate dehydrogenase complex protein LldG